MCGCGDDDEMGEECRLNVNDDGLPEAGGEGGVCMCYREGGEGKGKVLCELWELWEGQEQELW